MNKFLFLALLFSFATLADQYDDELKNYIERFNFRAVEISGKKEVGLFKLGEALFFDNEISGNRDISCATCHSPEFGTSDALPLSLGTGAVGEGNKRQATKSGQVIARHSPALFNLGHEEIKEMFWDGRLRHSKSDGVFITPEPGLNGDYPEFYEIVDLLDSALAAQALFPITSHDEMRGKIGENELADARTNFELWSRVMNRLLKLPKYQELFAKAFGGEAQFNIGHFARALGHFQKYAFIVDNTPWDNYLRGDLGALTEDEKRGAIAFVTKGMCANCHNGALLGGVGFFNAVAPQIGPGKNTNDPNNDEGLKLTTNKDSDAYRFKIPMLRNVSKSAPYFHSGNYTKLSDVIEHYTKGREAIRSYDSSVLAEFEKNNYKEKIFVETDKYRILKKQLTAHPLMQSKMIQLSSEDKRLIELFLTKSLTQP